MRMEEIRHRQAQVREGIAIRSVMGAKVLAKNGKEVGKVSEIYVHPDKLEVEGVRVHRGILKEDQFIGKGLIKTMNREAVVLADIPATELNGLEVYDSKGLHVGHVMRVNRVSNTNRLRSLEVDRGIVKPHLVVQGEHVDHVAESIFLTISVEN